jgi:tRNA threonylcarbamoyl adenosine modification protein YeaZ
MSIALGIFASMTKGGAAVSLASGNEILCSEMTSDIGRPSETLLQTIDEVLLKSKLSLSDLDSICSDIGPGSFTGIRVGLAALFGFVRALNISSLGLSSLELIASAHFRGETIGKNTSESQECFVITLIAAGRGEYYCAVYNCPTDGFLAPEVTKPALLSLDEAKVLQKKYDCVAVSIYGSVPLEAGCSSWVSVPQCSDIAALAAARIISKGRFNKGFAEPLYIRRSWAEEVKDSRG